MWSAILSFQKTNLLSPPEWVGLKNYEALTRDPIVKAAAIHSAIYTALFVPISVAGGLLTAVALNRKIRGIRWYRTAVFVPVVVSTIATTIIFLWVFDPHFGLANWLLAKVGLGPFGFFEMPERRAVLGRGHDRVGLDRVRRDRVPGGPAGDPARAGRGRGDRRRRDGGIFRNVTLPLLGPVTLFLVVWSSINALQLFDEVYLATNGGPGGATNVRRPLPLQAGVPAGDRGLRGGDRLRPVRGDPGAHGGPAAGGQADGALLGMSDVQLLDAPTAPERDEPTRHRFASARGIWCCSPWRWSWSCRWRGWC